MTFDISDIQHLLEAPLYPANLGLSIKTLAEIISPGTPEDAIEVIKDLDYNGIIKVIGEVVRHIVEVSEQHMDRSAAEQFAKVWSIKFATLTIPERSKRQTQKLLEYRDAADKALLDALLLASKISSARAVSPFGQRLRKLEEERRIAAEEAAKVTGSNPAVTLLKDTTPAFTLLEDSSPAKTARAAPSMPAEHHQALEDDVLPKVVLEDDQEARLRGIWSLNKDYYHRTRRPRDGDRQAKDTRHASKENVMRILAKASPSLA